MSIRLSLSSDFRNNNNPQKQEKRKKKKKGKCTKENFKKRMEKKKNSNKKKIYKTFFERLDEPVGHHDTTLSYSTCVWYIKTTPGQVKLACRGLPITKFLFLLPSSTVKFISQLLACVCVCFFFLSFLERDCRCAERKKEKKKLTNHKKKKERNLKI